MSIPKEFQVDLDGHTVDARRLDEFYNGHDGSRVTDTQWDTSRDRVVTCEEDLAQLGFTHIGDTCPEGDVFAEGVDHDG